MRNTDVMISAVRLEYYMSAANIIHINKDPEAVQLAGGTYRLLGVIWVLLQYGQHGQGLDHVEQGPAASACNKENDRQAGCLDAVTSSPRVCIVRTKAPLLADAKPWTLRKCRFDKAGGESSMDSAYSNDVTRSSLGLSSTAAPLLSSKPAASNRALEASRKQSLNHAQ